MPPGQQPQAQPPPPASLVGVGTGGPSHALVQMPTPTPGLRAQVTLGAAGEGGALGPEAGAVPSPRDLGLGSRGLPSSIPRGSESVGWATLHPKGVCSPAAKWPCPTPSPRLARVCVCLC